MSPTGPAAKTRRSKSRPLIKTYAPLPLPPRILAAVGQYEITRDYLISNGTTLDLLVELLETTKDFALLEITIEITSYPIIKLLGSLLVILPLQT